MNVYTVHTFALTEIYENCLFFNVHILTFFISTFKIYFLYDLLQGNELLIFFLNPC